MSTTRSQGSILVLRGLRQGRFKNTHSSESAFLFAGSLAAALMISNPQNLGLSAYLHNGPLPLHPTIGYITVYRIFERESCRYFRSALWTSYLRTGGVGWHGSGGKRRPLVATGHDMGTDVFLFVPQATTYPMNIRRQQHQRLPGVSTRAQGKHPLKSYTRRFRQRHIMPEAQNYI